MMMAAVNDDNNDGDDDNDDDGGDDDIRHKRALRWRIMAIRLSVRTEDRKSYSEQEVAGLRLLS